MESRLIVEVDGGQHAEQRQRDAVRTAHLREQGYRLLRFWNDDVLKDTDAVLEVIQRALRPPENGDAA